MRPFIAAPSPAAFRISWRHASWPRAKRPFSRPPNASSPAGSRSLTTRPQPQSTRRLRQLRRQGHPTGSGCLCRAAEAHTHGLGLYGGQTSGDGRVSHRRGRHEAASAMCRSHGWPAAAPVDGRAGNASEAPGKAAKALEMDDPTRGLRRHAGVRPPRRGVPGVGCQGVDADRGPGGVQGRHILHAARQAVCGGGEVVEEAAKAHARVEQLNVARCELSSVSPFSLRTTTPRRARYASMRRCRGRASLGQMRQTRRRRCWRRSRRRMRSASPPLGANRPSRFSTTRSPWQRGASH